MALFCPKCKSRRILFLGTSGAFAVGSTDQRYMCKDCDYSGAFILSNSKKCEYESWLSLGLRLTSGMFIGLLFSLILGYRLWHSFFLVILFALLSLLPLVLFTDKSEVELKKDLKSLKKKLIID